MNLLSQFWVVPMNIWKLLLFSENSSKLVNEHIYIYTVIFYTRKIGTKKKLEKLLMQTFLQQSAAV